MSVTDAIPKEWRSLIKNSDSSDTNCINKELKITIGGEKIASKTLKTKALYWFFVKNIALPPTNKERLTFEFQTQKKLLFTQNDKGQSENLGTSVLDIK